MPLQLVTALLFPLTRRAGGGRWGGALPAELGPRCRAANRFGGRAGARSVVKQEVKVLCQPQYAVMFLLETKDQKVIVGEGFVKE